MARTEDTSTERTEDVTAGETENLTIVEAVNDALHTEMAGDDRVVVFGELVASITDEALLYLEAPIERVTGFDVPVPSLSMEDYYVPNPPRIAAGIEDVLAY